MENTKDNTNIWVDIDKASEMIGLSSQTLKRKCRKGEFVFKIVNKNKIAHYFSTITCNQVWVSDHAQIDVACSDWYIEKFN